MRRPRRAARSPASPEITTVFSRAVSPAREGDGRFRDAEGLGEQRDPACIGAALVGDSGDPEAEDGAPSSRVSRPSMRSAPALGVTRRWSLRPAA